MENEIVKFECSLEGPHQFGASKICRQDLKRAKKPGTSHMIGAVAENRKGRTLRQFERAKQA